MKDIQKIEKIDISEYGLYKIKDVNYMYKKLKGSEDSIRVIKQKNEKLKSASTYNRNRYRFLKRIMNKIIKDHKERALPQFYVLREEESVESLMEKSNVDWYNED